MKSIAEVINKKCTDIELVEGCLTHDICFNDSPNYRFNMQTGEVERKPDEELRFDLDSYCHGFLRTIEQ